MASFQNDLRVGESLFGAGGSNYAFLFSDSSQFHNHFSDLSLNISTDFLTFSTQQDCHQQLFNSLDYAGFQTTQEGFDGGGIHKRRRFFQHVMYPRMSAGVSYNRRPYLPKRPELMATLFRPTKTLVAYLNQLFEGMHIKPNLSKMELSFDFRCTNLKDLYIFICLCLFLINQRKPSFFIKSTFYSNDLRSCSRGIRLYIKQIGNDIFLRLELILTQAPLRRNNIEWPPYNIDDIDIFKILNFVRFDADYLYKILRKYYDSVGASDPVSDEIISEVIDHLLSIPVLQAVDFLKHNHIPNYGRSLKTLIWFHDWMTAQMQGQSFLPVGEPL